MAFKYLPNYRTISESNEEQDFYIEQQSNGKNEEDFEVGFNSARKSKQENFNSIIDDEDASNIVKKTKKNLYSNASTNIVKLRLDELDFIPPCEIKTKEAVSAIHRAKTQKCKQFIANITCLSYIKKLYPNELKSECPANGFATGKQLGCFKDEKIFVCSMDIMGSIRIIHLIIVLNYVCNLDFSMLEYSIRKYSLF